MGPAPLGTACTVLIVNQSTRANLAWLFLSSLVGEICRPTNFAVELEDLFNEYNVNFCLSLSAVNGAVYTKLVVCDVLVVLFCMRCGTFLSGFYSSYNTIQYK